MNRPINKFHFITAVWGANHSRAYLEVGLPSLLSSGNLPGINARRTSTYHLFTKASDLPTIQESAPFRYLQDLIAVETSLIEEDFEIAPHLMMSRCHRDGLRRAHELNAGAVFVPPECVWANDSMVKLERIASRGIPIVHMTGLRLVLEEAMPRLVSEWRAKDGKTLEIPPRDLVRLGLQHLHPIAKDLFFRGQSETLMPANLLWIVNGDGILAHCFHLHPLLVEPNKRNAMFKTTIDDDLALVSDPAGDRDYVVQDSDEIFAFELSPFTHVVQANYEKGSVDDVAAWAEVGMNPRHRMLVRKPIRIHATDVSTERWAGVEKEAEAVVREALALVDQPTWYLVEKGYAKNVWHRQLAATLRSQNAEAAHKRSLSERVGDAKLTLVEKLNRAPAELKVSPTQQFLHTLRVERHLLSPSTKRIIGSFFSRARQRFQYWSLLAKHYATATPALTRYYKFLVYQWVYNLNVATRNRLRIFPFSLYSLLVKLIHALTRSTHRVFGLTPNVYPWHWKWPYEKEVLRPVLAITNGAAGSTLIIAGHARALDPENLPGYSIRSLETLDEDTHGECASLYDRIVCFLFPDESVDCNLGLLGSLLLPGGELLVCISPANRSALAELERSVPSNLRVSSQYELGSIGTALLARMHFRYLRLPTIHRIRTRASYSMLVLRLLLFPLTLVLFPAASASCSALNLFGKRQGLSAATIVTIRNV